MGSKLPMTFVVLSLMVVVVFQGSKVMSLCNISDDGLNQCKPSVSGSNPVDPPTPECCKALTNADIPCLCSYKNSPMLPLLGIDPDLAIALPAKCNLPPAEC